MSQNQNHTGNASTLPPSPKAPSNGDKTVIQRTFERLPDTTKRRVYRHYLRASPARATIAVSRSPLGWTVRNYATGDEYAFPAQPNIGQLDKVSAGYAGRMQSKYLPTEVVGELDGIQTVVDVGAFVGGFARAAATIADRVIAIEPSPATVECLRANTADQDIEVVTAAVGEEDGLTIIRLGEDPSDNGRLAVDDRATGEHVETKLFRLATVAADHDLGRIDILKVDAEGAEPEVLTGLDDIDARIVTVDTTPERNGDSTRTAVSNQLAECGYQVHHQPDVTIGVSDHHSH